MVTRRNLYVKANVTHRLFTHRLRTSHHDNRCRSISASGLAVRSVAYARSRGLIRKRLRIGAGCTGRTTAASNAVSGTFHS